MRILSVILALILLALAGLALALNLPAPIADEVHAILPAPYIDALSSIIPAPYADRARAILPTAIAGLAFLLFIAVIATRAPAQAAPKPVRLRATEPPESKADAEAVNLLSIFQDKGRLVDFLMDDIAGYSDAQVGAAGRVLHQGCRAALLEHFGIKPIREEGEGSKVTVPPQYAPDDYRLVGKINGEPPFTGTLVHHGWKAEWVKLPRLVTTGATRLPAIAPAEVEVR
jgi:hypothetical protein